MSVTDLLQRHPQGLYCPPARSYIDPLRPVEQAIITHAHADHARPGHKAILSSAEGWPLLRHRLGDISGQPLAYGQRLRVHDATISLHPAGHIRGSAQVLIEVGGQRLLITGDFKRDPDATCTPFEPVPADILVSETTFGLPVYRWPSFADVVADIRAWWQACRDRDETAVLCCYALGKAQRLLHALRDSEEPILAHGALLPLTALYAAAGVPLAALEPATVVKRGAAEGRLVLCPPSAVGTPWMRRFPRASVAFASGWMLLRGHRRRRGVDRGFVVSDHADWPGLLRTVDEVNPQQVLFMHGDTDPIVRFLREQGRDAQALSMALGPTPDAPVSVSNDVAS